MTSVLRANILQNSEGVQGLALASNGVVVSTLPTVSRVHNTNVSTTGAIVIVGFGSTAIDTIGSSVFGSYAIRPQRAGTYLLIADLRFTGTSPGAWTPTLYLYQNGSSILNISNLINYTGGHSGEQHIHRLVAANGTSDYFEIAWGHNNGNSYTVNGGGFTMIRTGS
jgi:hypothetical protein